MGCRANTDCSHELMRWERETATTQKESTRSWFVRAGGSSGACDTMEEGGGQGSAVEGTGCGIMEGFKEGRMHRERWGREGRIKGHRVQRRAAPLIWC